MTININDFCPLAEHIPCVREDGQDWFFAENICRALQIEGGPTALKQHLPERGRFEITPAYARTEDDRVLLISEAAFYEQVLASGVPAAERFKSWVLTVVLPTLLEDGIYILGEEHSYPTPDCKSEHLSVSELTMWWDWVYRVLQELRCDKGNILNLHVLIDEPQSVRETAIRKMVTKKFERRARLQREAA